MSPTNQEYNDLKDLKDRLEALIVNIRDDLDELISNIDNEVEIVEDEQ